MSQRPMCWSPRLALAGVPGLGDEGVAHAEPAPVALGEGVQPRVQADGGAVRRSALLEPM
jgi:hypothetical protein